MRASSNGAQEDVAFKDLSNALLEILDRQVDTKSGKDRSGYDRKTAADQLHSKAAEITETLKESPVRVTPPDHTVYKKIQILVVHHSHQSCISLDLQGYATAFHTITSA